MLIIGSDNKYWKLEVKLHLTVNKVVMLYDNVRWTDSCIQSGAN